MAGYEKLTEVEINDLRFKFEELLNLFERDNYEFLEFERAPIRYLRNFGILVMRYIDNNQLSRLSSRLSQSIRNVLRHLDFLDRCSWCKILALVTIYAVIGAARVTVYNIRGLIGDIIEAIEGIFNMANDIVQRIRNLLNNINDYLSPYRLARLICEQLGYCPYE